MRPPTPSVKSLSFNKLNLWFPLVAVALATGPVLAGPGKPPVKKDPAAVLAVVSGGVKVHRGEAILDGSFGASLEAGDVVETGSDAQAAVLFESGQIIELGPGSRIAIGSVPAKDAGGPVLAQVPDAFSGSLAKFAQSASAEAGMSALPDLRAGSSGEKPVPLSPRNTRLGAEGVSFRWTGVEDALEYRVHLSGPGAMAGDHPATGESWTPPEGSAGFSPGQRWTWSVEAITPDGSIRSEDVAFEIASAEQWGELESLKERLAPLLGSKESTRIDTAGYLLGSYCRSSGFYDEAIVHLEGLAGRHPERKELHRELGSLYQAIGRNDKAAEEYRLALKD